jgi:hypothetical protein
MAACDPITFSGVTPQIFESIRKELAGKGFDLPGHSGIVNGPFGITIEYAWNEGNQTLFAQVTEKSFFVPCNQIYDQLSSAISKYIA